MNDMLKPIDELFTPGCPNCAVKHLSAALATLALAPKTRVVPAAGPLDAKIKMARAMINLIESQQGYASHKEFAIGLLDLAAQSAIVYGNDEVAEIARDIRISVMTGNLRSALTRLDLEVEQEYRVYAHIAEAWRELPAMFEDRGYPITCPKDPTDLVLWNTDEIISLIREVQDTYFAPPVVGGQINNQKGESKMATTKKSTKATAKGGCAKKSAKAAAKGGCTKKACKK